MSCLEEKEFPFELISSLNRPGDTQRYNFRQEVLHIKTLNNYFRKLGEINLESFDDHNQRVADRNPLCSWSFSAVPFLYCLCRVSPLKQGLTNKRRQSIFQAENNLEMAFLPVA